jgi:hypothetical protein
MAEAKAIFDALDVDGNGTLDKDELWMALVCRRADNPGPLRMTNIPPLPIEFARNLLRVTKRTRWISGSGHPRSGEARPSPTR